MHRVFLKLQKRYHQSFIGFKPVHRPFEQLPCFPRFLSCLAGMIADVFQKIVGTFAPSFLALLAQYIMAGVHRNSDQPVAERGIPTVRTKFLVGPDKHLLAEVFQLVPIVAETGGEPEDSPLMPRYKQGECLIAAANGSFDEAFIGRLWSRCIQSLLLASFLPGAFAEFVHALVAFLLNRFYLLYLTSVFDQKTAAGWKRLQINIK